MRDEIKRIRANGLELAYLEAGSGPLLMLLHGFPDTADGYADVMQPLAAAGYRVVAPFLRGYHPSGIPADGDYSAHALGTDALALAAALGHERFSLVGHDWGALAAYAAANLSPARIIRLATIAIPHPRSIPPDPRLLWRAPHFLLFQFGRLSEWQVARNDLAYIDHLYRYWSPNWNPPAGEVEGVKAGFRLPGRLRAALGYYRCLIGDARNLTRMQLYRRRVSVPTLAFAGGSDGALDAGLYERTPEAFSGPYEVAIFDRAGHFLHREEPARFVERLLGFLGPATQQPAE